PEWSDTGVRWHRCSPVGAGRPRLTNPGRRRLGVCHAIGVLRYALAPTVTAYAEQPLGPSVAEAEVKARGYWELIWIRFRRDRAAVTSGIFIIVLVTAAFALAPLFQAWLGHGPNDIFADGVQHSKPVGPWTWVSTAPYEGAVQLNG